MATFQPISSQELECPICLTLFNQPKSLTCSHTFCKDCLEMIFQTQPDQHTTTCPVCREGTPVPSGDVSDLQTNERLSSLVDEMKTKNPTCTNCGIDQESPTVSYCQDCGIYMCKSCEINHLGWKPFLNHEVVPVGDVLSGKVPLKRRRKCRTHPSADKECYCTHCREYICTACGMVEHLQDGHQLEKAAVHEEKLIKNIKKLRKRTQSKKTTIDNHIKFIEIQRNEITDIMKRLDNNIDKTYEEYMKLLLARREALKCQVKRLSEKFENALKVMQEEGRRQVSYMNGMKELVKKGMKIPLERDALFAHDTLCENLKSFLERDDPDDQLPRGVTERAQKISFRKYEKVNVLRLGELEGYTLGVKADVDLRIKDSMNCMTCAPDGNMAVGSVRRGIHLYSPDGELQQRVLKDVHVANIGFLSDCRIVVRDTKNKISLYTPQWKKLDVTFETMSEDEGIGSLTVGRDDDIYVGYWKNKMIQVFPPQGGKTVKEIMCDGSIPGQLFCFHTTEKLLLTNSPAVVCIDSKGKKENVLKKEGMLAYPAVCRDDSVIVAWVKHEEGLVSIDRYTRDLEHVHNIITDFKILRPISDMPKLSWYYLQEFESGEIAFCTTDRLYIFDVNCEVS